MTPAIVSHPASAAADLALDLQEIDKVYSGRVHALRSIAMRVARGEVFGLLGPNGAGKSTLVKVLMTVIRATKARGSVLGHPVGHKRTLERVGYLPEHHRFPDYLTGRQVVDFYGAMAGTPRRERKQRCGHLLEFVGMSAWADKRVKAYSKGMRQRVGIAQALVNDPDLVLLDEPTDGVDPVGRRDIRLMVQDLKQRGKTVLLNSHLLSELEMVCDRVAILVQGRVVSHGTIDSLTRDQRQYVIEVELPPGSPDDHAAGLLPEGLVREGGLLPGEPAAGGVPARRVAFRGFLASGESLEVERDTIRIGTTEARAVQQVIDALRGRAVTIRAVRPVRPSLEDLFMQAVTDPTTGQALKPGASKDGKRRAGPSAGGGA